jgi:hypothetical protein
VALVGDVAGDGDGALLIGAPYGKNESSSPGVAYLLRAAPTTDVVLHSVALRLYGEGDWHGAGARVAAAGDLDGDGLQDVLVGASAANFGGTDSGAAYVWLASSLHGLDGAVDIGGADGRHHGESSYDMAGYGLAGGGDVDGDGLDDVVVGAPYEDGWANNAGAAYLLLGPATGASSLSAAPMKLLGARQDDNAGNGVAVVPDTDGDGHADLLVGAPVYEDATGSGWAALWTSSEGGSWSLAESPWILQGEQDGDYLGFSVAGPGDMDGDGLGDLLVGASLDDGAGDQAGAVSVVFGPL